ncbi:toprim domain-containing protein [Kaistella anthropi]|nr:toprim domain-containing protein [Kaistella anthropi]
MGKKDVTHFKNGSEKLKIFEGFFDFLSFKSIEKSCGNSNTDYLILNSVFLIKNKFSLLENYQNIELFLDNDEAGSIITDEIIKKFPNAEDCRFLYENFKDLNEFVAR